VRRAGGDRARRARPWWWWTRSIVFAVLVVGFPAIVILLTPGRPSLRRRAETQAQSRLRRLRDAIQAWEARFGAYPPSRLSTRTTEGSEATPFRAQPPNSNNEGIEALYLALARTDLLPPEAEFFTTNTDADVIAGGKANRRCSSSAIRQPLRLLRRRGLRAARPAELRHRVRVRTRPVRPGAVRRLRQNSLFSWMDGEPNTDDDLSVEDLGGGSHGPQFVGAAYDEAAHGPDVPATVITCSAGLRVPAGRDRREGPLPSWRPWCREPRDGRPQPTIARWGRRRVRGRLVPCCGGARRYDVGATTTRIAVGGPTGAADARRASRRCCALPGAG
jgi:hypothetical protein